MIQADRPVAYWRFDGERPLAGAGDALVGAAIGQLDTQFAGPQAPEYPLFDENNTALLLRGHGYVRIVDDKRGLLKFRQGDSMTLEAWVNPAALGNDQNVYVVGKGRTGTTGAAAENQNYSLRLRASTARPT